VSSKDIGAHSVVMKLVDGLGRKELVVVMNNYFPSMALLTQLTTLEIYANRIMRLNRLCLRLDWRPKRIETILHKRHCSGKCIRVGELVFNWKAKQLVFLISTHALPIVYPHVLVPMVSCRNKVVGDSIQTSYLCMHLEYITHMRGVNMAD